MDPRNPSSSSSSSRSTSLPFLPLDLIRELDLDSDSDQQQTMSSALDEIRNSLGYKLMLAREADAQELQQHQHLFGTPNRAVRESAFASTSEQDGHPQTSTSSSEFSSPRSDKTVMPDARHKQAEQQNGSFAFDASNANRGSTVGLSPAVVLHRHAPEMGTSSLAATLSPRAPSLQPPSMPSFVLSKSSSAPLLGSAFLNAKAGEFPDVQGDNTPHEKQDISNRSWIGGYASNQDKTPDPIGTGRKDARQQTQQEESAFQNYDSQRNGKAPAQPTSSSSSSFNLHHRKFSESIIPSTPSIRLEPPYVSRHSRNYSGADMPGLVRPPAYALDSRSARDLRSQSLEFLKEASTSRLHNATSSSSPAVERGVTGTRGLEDPFVERVSVGAGGASAFTNSQRVLSPRKKVEEEQNPTTPRSSAPAPALQSSPNLRYPLGFSPHHASSSSAFVENRSAFASGTTPASPFSPNEIGGLHNSTRHSPQHSFPQPSSSAQPQTTAPPPSLPNLTPTLHRQPFTPDTSASRLATRQTWIQTAAAQISAYARLHQAASARYEQNPTAANEAAMQKARGDLVRATDLESRVRERRELFMPEGVQVLRMGDLDGVVGDGEMEGEGGYAGQGRGALLGGYWAVLERVAWEGVREVQKREKEREQEEGEMGGNGDGAED